MTEHLTETQVSSFRERTLRPTERERIDSHVADCDSCLRRILPAEDSALVYSELSDALLADNADEAFHLSHADAERYANGSIDHADRVIFESHLELCDQCSETVQSLNASPLVGSVSPLGIQSEVPTQPFPPVWSAAFQFTPARAIAAVLVTASLVFAFVVWRRWHAAAVDQTAQKTSGQPSNTPGNGLPPPAQIESPIESTQQVVVIASLQDNGRTIQLDNRGKLIGLEELPESSRSLVRDVLTNRTLSKPNVLDKLTASSIKLMDPAAGENMFGLLGPSGTVIATDRPNLRWQALAGATSYSVSVFDADFNRVTSSAPQPGTHWTSTRLRRGMIYSWEVVAVRNGQEVRSPIAPAPRAQFKVLEAEKLLELINLKKHKPISHLTLAVTYARFGLLTEAEGELQILARENPDSPVAAKLLRTVQEWRER